MCVEIRAACTVASLRAGEKLLDDSIGVRAPLMVTDISATPGYATVVNLVTGHVFEMCHNVQLAMRDDGALYVSRRLNKPTLLGVPTPDDYCDLTAEPPS